MKQLFPLRLYIYKRLLLKKCEAAALESKLACREGVKACWLNFLKASSQ